ncbi:MAG: hypothetical protein KME23_20380 [Goleter apudmare HA4340-LM2]|jgi:predicted lipid-binding transport protein (Tim44 family)|nr:hypothetical protein [Goleter apudmare HA4340-LM2]
MDFIKKLIGGILGFLTGLIGGILGFVTGLLPKKKSNGFYLELDEAATGAKPKVEAKSASNGKKAAEPVAAVASPAPASPAPTAVKATTAKAATNGKAPKAEPVKAAPASVAKKTPTETTFAPKYVAASVSSSNGRRRPGANMNAYLDMARQVKTPG